MFGLEGDKNKKSGGFSFDLEKELKDPKKAKEIQQNVELQTRKLENILRQGGSKEEGFDRFSILLVGYAALLKVAGRSIKGK